jgi:glycosyltransferase involved in cell wall biosynthesis
MDVSLIICTRNRSEQLRLCLASVNRISFERRWELIVVDNGSVDDTSAVVQKFMRTASVPVTHVFESAPGLANARNAGLKHACGNILAFTDDDCYPENDFLSQVWSAFEDPAVGYITGRIMLHDPTDYPVTVNESATQRTFPQYSFLDVGAVMGANMAFRREVIDQIGGFDPLFGAGSLLESAEDLDAASCASAAGWAGQYRPDVIVRHHHGRKATDITGLQKSYDIGRGAYYMKLLLKGRRFIWFARSVWRMPKRVRWYHGAIGREVVGYARYACAYIFRR